MRKKNVILPLFLAFLAFLLFQYFIVYDCPLRTLTGFSCPCCGMTRAWRCFLRGDIYGALYWHPLFLIPLPAVLLLLFKDKIPKKIYDISMGILLSLLIIVYIYRMAVSSPALNRDFREGLIWRRFQILSDLIRNLFNG